jgi:polyhydroxyalkanoate synthesis regulator phasin
MKKILLLGVACGLMVLGGFVSARASEVDILVDKLVQKGLLNKQDATEVIQAVKEESWKEKDQERAEVIKGTKDAIKKDNPSLFAGEIPEWVRKMQLKGDLRLRYENIDRDVDNFVQRDRYRYRLRLGFLTKIAEDMEVGFGFASGTDDPRSTNQTYGKEFNKGDIRIDYAYAKYKPFSWVTLIGGKFENPLWRPTDTFWDSDINPDGMAAQFTYAYSPSIDLFMNTGWFIIDEQ